MKFLSPHLTRLIIPEKVDNFSRRLRTERRAVPIFPIIDRRIDPVMRGKQHKAAYIMDLLNHFILAGKNFPYRRTDDL